MLRWLGRTLAFPHLTFLKAPWSRQAEGKMFFQVDVWFYSYEYLPGYKHHFVAIPFPWLNKVVELFYIYLHSGSLEAIVLHANKLRNLCIARCTNDLPLSVPWGEVYEDNVDLKWRTWFCPFDRGNDIGIFNLLCFIFEFIHCYNTGSPVGWEVNHL